MSLFLRRMSFLYTTTRNAAIYKATLFYEFCNTFSAKYNNVLAKPDSIAKKTWEDMRTFVHSEFRPPMIDSCILEIFKFKEYPDAGIAYYKFLENNNYNPTVITTSIYLQLYELKQPISEIDKNHILNIYNNIINNYNTLDRHLTQVLCTILSMIGEWKEIIKLIDKFEATDSFFLRRGYSALIACLFDNNEITLGYKYLIIHMQKDSRPSDRVYESYIKYCMKDKDKFNERVERLFTLWSNSTTNPSHKVIFEYMRICNEYGWSTKETIFKGSICSVCKQDLSDMYLTDEQYKRLLNVTKDKLILNNMYLVSTPQEVTSFIKYIDERKPYEIIIDGLNILYNGWNGELKLKRILRDCRMRNEKVLVIGKRHMLRRLKEVDILELADFFYVNNLSKDDMFILYAAFSSGRKVKVLSNDFMRQHKFAVQNIELVSLFRKWQLIHQYVFDLYAERGNKYVKRVMEPLVQKTNNCWHIPYYLVKLKQKQNWVCFNMRP